MVSAAITGMTSQAVSSVQGVVNNSESETSSGVSFKQIMSKSLSNNNTRGQVKSEIGNKANEVNKNADETVKSEKVEQPKEVKTTDSEDKVTQTDENLVKDEVKEVVKDVKEAIKEELNVSDKEIEDMMAELGMMVSDLLDPQKLTDLMAALSGSEDAISFITDSDMLDNLNKVLEVLNNGLEEVAQKLEVAPQTVKETAAEIDFSDVKEEIFTENKNIAPEKKEDVRIVKEEQTDEGTTLQEVVAKKLTVETSNSTASTNYKGASNESEAKAGKEFNEVANNIAQNISEAFNEISVSEDQMINEVDVVRQVIDNIKITAGQELQSIEVILNPANLGNVHVTVSAKEGVVTAQLTAENEQVKAALENQIISLKEHFNNQGIKVEAVEVTIASHSFESNQNLEGNNSNQAQQERKTSRRLDLGSLEDLDDEDLTTDELRARDSIVNGNSSVEFKA